MARVFQFGGIIASMHILGSAVFFGYTGGPLAALAAPALGILGWFFVLPEVIGAGLQWIYYNPHPKSSKVRIWGYAFLSAIVGGVFVSLFTPKEQGNESEFWIAGFLAGSVAAVFSFWCIHTIKSSEYKQAAGRPAQATGVPPTPAP
jgi:hypothetical protein